MRSCLALLAAIALGGCAATPAETARAQQAAAAQQDRLAAALKGLRPTAHNSCVNQLDLRNAQVEAYGRTLLYTVTNRRKYRTDTTGGCEQVGRNDILVTQTTVNSLCRGDIAYTVDRSSGFRSGSCSFGDFATYQ